MKSVGSFLRGDMCFPEKLVYDIVARTPKSQSALRENDNRPKCNCGAKKLSRSFCGCCATPCPTARYNSEDDGLAWLAGSAWRERHAVCREANNWLRYE